MNYIVSEKYEVWGLHLRTSASNLISLLTSSIHLLQLYLLKYRITYILISHFKLI